MTTISQTVEQTLRSNGLSGYTAQARPVITALETREEQIKSSLRSYASQRGLSGTEVNDLFIRVGLEERAPAPAASRPQASTTTTPGDDRAMLDRLDSLERSVRELADLANRHLGASVRR